MKLPDEWKVFERHVTEKVKTYCDNQIWNKPYAEFAAWLNNFKDNNKDRYTALHFLDALVYRSKAMARASYSRYLSLSLRQFLIDEQRLELTISLSEWRKYLSTGWGGSINLRFCAVKLDGDSGDSGDNMIRLMTGGLVSEKLLTDVKSLSHLEKNTIIVFVDDFMGSSHQFCDFADEIDLKCILEQHVCIFAPFMAMSSGVARLKEKYSHLKVQPLEVLGSDLSFFYQSDKYFRNDTLNNNDDFRSHLLEMKRRHAPKMSDWLGREEAGLCVAFEWGAPNQTFPLLWMTHSKVNENWQRLFWRRN